MLANLAPNLSQIRNLQSRAMQQDSGCAFQEASTHACRLQHFQAMFFRCIEYLRETWLVYVPPGSKEKILDSVHKSYLRWIYYHFQERTRWEEVVQRDTSEILCSEGHIRDPRNTRMGGKEQKAEKNESVFWGRQGPRRGCNVMNVWMDGWVGGRMCRSFSR